MLVVNIVPDHSKPFVVWTGNEEAHGMPENRDLIVVAQLKSLADREAQASSSVLHLRNSANGQKDFR